MRQHYYILNWDRCFEVDSHGKPWEPGQPFRKGPLTYLRVKASRDWRIEEIELHDQLGDEMYAALAVFQQLCLTVASESRCRREGGIIRNSSGDPATDEELMRMLRLSEPTWKKLAAALCHPHVRWLGRGEDSAAHRPTPPAQRPQADPVPEPTETPEGGKVPEIPGVPAIPGVAGIPLSSQVKSKQNNTKQVESKGAVPVSQLLVHRMPPAPELRPDVSSPVLRDSTRLGFLYEIRRTLRAQEQRDCRTVSNFEQWIWENVKSGRAGPELLARSLAIAKDCVHGDKPVAVFLARVKQELGYVAPSRRTAAPALEV